MAGSQILKKKWVDLEAKIFHLFKNHEISNQKILVAVSGGLDSMVLLNLLTSVQNVLKLEIIVGHVHHGLTPDRKLNQFRNEAHDFVKKRAEKLGLRFEAHLSPESQSSQSEASLREIRLRGLKAIAEQNAIGLTAFAHHQDDLLETRLIRLIRGVGAEGVRSMKINAKGRLRPLLQFSRRQLKDYAGERLVEWIEDPSNKSTGPLRNWIRQEWLPSLEIKRAGATQSLARSLENLAENSKSEWVSQFHDQRGVNRAALLTLSRQEKRQVIASYLRLRGNKDYSLAHIEELLKRVESPDKNLSFRLINCLWKVNAEYIEII